MGKNGSSDGIDAFVASVLNAGFGSGGEAAEIEVSQRIFQVGFSRILNMLIWNVLKAKFAHKLASH